MSKNVEIWLNNSNPLIGATATHLRLAERLKKRKGIDITLKSVGKDRTNGSKTDFAIGSHFTHPLTQRADNGIFWVHSASKTAAERAKGVSRRNPTWTLAGVSTGVSSAIPEAITLHPLMASENTSVKPLKNELFERHIKTFRERFDGIILNAGGNSLYKGADYLLDIAINNPNIGILIASAQYGKRQAAKIEKALKALDNVIIMPAFEFNDDAFKAVDGLIVTSPAEGFCLTAAEATRAGTPVIVRRDVFRVISEATLDTAVSIDKSVNLLETLEEVETPRVKTALNQREDETIRRVIELINA